MITGVHTMFYTPKAEELRAFIRDKLGFPYSDVGEGWLIFELPSADMGCHPADHNSHDISFYCDDIHTTVAELKERGVEFSSEVRDAGFGLIALFRMPGDMEVQLYQPKYVKTPHVKSEGTSNQI